MVNVHVFTLLPPLEHAPDQIASRVFVTLSVIDVPVLNAAEPVLPTATLIPAGLELTRSPLRPVAVTESVAVWAGGAGGFTVSVAVLLTPPKLPPIVTDVAAVTPVVVILKLALVAPAATVTLAGMPATVVLLLDSVTTAPPAGAAEVKVTVPVLPAPPTTLAGLTVSVDRVGAAATGFTVNTAVRVMPPKLAEMVGAVEAVTVDVAIVKVALVAPAATVTLAGTLATALELLRLTTAPPAGAPEVSVTVPCDELPPTTELGARLTADKLATGGGGGVPCGVTRRTAENDPATPAELTARTRQKSDCAGRPPIVACDTLTVWLVVSVVKLLEVEIWIRYVAAFAASLQSNRIGWATLA